jgi:hypothetical protein
MPFVHKCNCHVRKPVQLQLELFDARESPTALFGPNPLASSLGVLSMTSLAAGASPAVVEASWHSPITDTSSISLVSSPKSSQDSQSSVAAVGATSQIQAAGTPGSVEAESWASFSTVDDMFADPFGLDPALVSKPHSGSSFSAGASEEAHPHSSSSDGGGSASGGGGFSSSGAGASFGAGSVSDRSQGSALGGLVSSGSNSPSAPVAHAPGSEIGASGLPTNFLLVPAVQPTTNHGLLTTDTTPLTINHPPLTYAPT